MSSPKPLNRFVAAFWAIFGGSLGLHRFYLRQWKCALPYIILSLVGSYLLVQVLVGHLSNQEEIIRAIREHQFPPEILADPQFNLANVAISAPALVSFIEGLIYLFTPKTKWDKAHNG